MQERPSFILKYIHAFFGAGYTDGNVGADITIGDITMTSFYLGYTLSFFSALWSLLGALMVYNLLAMFGLDVKIGDFSRSLMQWVTTPPTEEQLEEIEAADTFD